MSYYDVALICKNGHIINSSSKEDPVHNRKFCTDCGAETINSCQNSVCNSEIKGTYNVTGDFGYSLELENAPSYCPDCGNPYPWIDEKIKALNEILELSDITEEEKEDFNRNLPDIISETPRTNVAALKLKIIGTKVGKEIWEVAKGVIVEIASETAKKTMGL